MPVNCVSYCTDIAPLHRSVKGKSATAVMDCTSTACEAVQAPGISQDVLANAKHFLDCNDKAMVSRLIQGVNRPARSKRNMYACGDHTEMCKSMEYGDAYMLQTHMHAFNGNCCSQIQVEHNYPSQMEIDLTEGQCISGICPNIVHYVPTPSHTVSQSVPMDACIHNIDNTQVCMGTIIILVLFYFCPLSIAIGLHKCLMVQFGHFYLKIMFYSINYIYSIILNNQMF